MSTLGGEASEGAAGILFGVLDGHGGPTCSEYCLNNVPNNFSAALSQVSWQGEDEGGGLQYVEFLLGMSVFELFRLRALRYPE